MPKLSLSPGLKLNFRQSRGKCHRDDGLLEDKYIFIFLECHAIYPHNLGSTLHVTPGVKIKTELFTPFLPKGMSRKELGDNGKEKT